jgi:uncharacterized membrane protein YozB (DUF420 family)
MIQTQKQDRAKKLLLVSGATWFGVAMLGQIFFLTYILGFYAPPTASGHFEEWSKHRQVIDGYVAGDFIGNLQFGLHILMAAILTFGGLAQILPAVRNRFRLFHRWNGRIFAVAALLASIGGLWLVWVRGSIIELSSSIGTSLNGVIIIICVVMAWRCARQRQFAAHERWAMRAFLTVSGVWFLRVGIMAFSLLTSGALGMPSSYTDGFFPIWSYGSYLVPLAIYELYWRAKQSRSPTIAYGMTGLMFGISGLTLVGIGGAALVMWLPPLWASWGI